MEKKTFTCIAKSDSTAIKHIQIPCISQPFDVPAETLRDKGIELKQCRELPSVLCVAASKMSVLWRNEDNLPMFIVQAQRSERDKSFTQGEAQLLMLFTSMLQQRLQKFLVLATKSGHQLGIQEIVEMLIEINGYSNHKTLCRGIQNCLAKMFCVK